MLTLSFANILLLGIATLSIVGLLTPLMRNIAIKLNVVDFPTEPHKTHVYPIPYLGGVAIILGVIVVTYMVSFVSQFTKSTFLLASTILIPAFAMGLVGLIDDMRKLMPWPRFLMQTFFGLVISLSLVLTETLGSPFGNSWIDIPLTSLWIVGITNAVNFFDNIDGGASGAMFISSSFLSFLAWQSGQILISAMSVVVAGATLGFLIWNRPPARIYMGDAGALFLGVLMASLSTRFDPSPVDIFASYSIPILLLAIPIMDTSVAVLSRIQEGISPFQGGRDHLSHRLMRLGYSKQKAVLILWFLSLFFCLLATGISNASDSLERPLMLLALMCWLIFSTYFLRLKRS